MYSPINFKSLLCFLRECLFLKAFPVLGSLPDGVPDRATMPSSFYVGPQLMSLCYLLGFQLVISRFFGCLLKNEIGTHRL